MIEIMGLLVPRRPPRWPAEALVRQSHGRGRASDFFGSSSLRVFAFSLAMSYLGMTA
jgi:hypothetical protein